MNFVAEEKPLQPGEIGVLKSIAARQLIKLKDAFTGVTNVDESLLAQILEALSKPMSAIYSGHLTEEARKAWSEVAGTNKLTQYKTDADAALGSLIKDAEIKSLSQYRSRDIDRIKIASAYGTMSEKLLVILIEFRGEVFRTLYHDILQSEAKVTFGRTPPTPITSQTNNQGSKQPLIEDTQFSVANAGANNKTNETSVNIFDSN